MVHITEERGIKMALIKKTANDANLIINEASWNEVNELKKSMIEE